MQWQFGWSWRIKFRAKHLHEQFLHNLYKGSTFLPQSTQLLVLDSNHPSLWLTSMKLTIERKHEKTISQQSQAKIFHKLIKYKKYRTVKVKRSKLKLLLLQNQWICWIKQKDALPWMMKAKGKTYGRLANI